LREGLEVLPVAVEWREPAALEALLDRVCAPLTRPGDRGREAAERR
jgi:hypothetical protein